MRNVLMAVSGPSGVGKGTIVKRIIKERDDVVESVSCTTRPPRQGEVHGREYFFLSKEEFEKRIQENDFLEYDKHFENYYGTPKSFMEIDVVGSLNAKKYFPETVLVMVVPPSVDELKARLKGRQTETDEEIEGRLARMEYELSHKDVYDYILVNDDLEKAIEEMKTLLDNEKNK